MIINHPNLGPRDAAEFTVLGDASLLNRPNWRADNADDAFYRYMYLRDNPAGLHRELWFHEQGDRSWLVVTRDTLTHAVLEVTLARDVVLASQTTKASKASRAPYGARAERNARAQKPTKRSITGGQPR